MALRLDHGASARNLSLGAAAAQHFVNADLHGSHCDIGRTTGRMRAMMLTAPRPALPCHRT
jgi:hypothetical protein